METSYPIQEDKLQSLLLRLQSLPPHLLSQTRKEVGRLSPELFALIYLPHLLTHKTSSFHKELYSLVNELRVAIAAPRSFAKSTVFSFIYALWSALYGKKQDILLISATGALSEEWLRRIKNELENNELIIQDFGYVKSKKWTESHIILANKTQIRAKGAGYQIRGFRPDCVICDDLENDEAVRSRDQRAKMEDWFFKSLLNTLNPGAQLIVVGTILHPLSFLNNMMNDPKPGWWTKKYAAYREDGTALWPEKWPAELLEERKREIGERRFRSEFMNDPLADDTLVFRSEWVEDNRVKAAPLLEELQDFIVAVDPAISKRALADETAIVTVARHKETKHIYIVEAKHGRWSAYETVEEMVRTYQRFKPRTFLVEEVAYQAALKEVFLKETRKKGLYVPVRPALADRDKIRRARRIEHLFEQGLVHVLEDQKELAAQLILFPNGEHDDLVDATVYALAAIHDNNASIVKPKAKVARTGVTPLADILNIELAKRPKRSKSWYNL